MSAILPLFEMDANIKININGETRFGKIKEINENSLKPLSLNSSKSGAGNIQINCRRKIIDLNGTFDIFQKNGHDAAILLKISNSQINITFSNDQKKMIPVIWLEIVIEFNAIMEHKPEIPLDTDDWLKKQQKRLKEAYERRHRHRNRHNIKIK